MGLELGEQAGAFDAARRCWDEDVRSRRLWARDATIFSNRDEAASGHFVSITDPGASLEARARKDGFLGIALGGLAQAGRDPLSLSLSPSVESLGAGIEQLVAESTDKADQGLLPIPDEGLFEPGRYARDRIVGDPAVVGAVLGLNPLDQPDVEAAMQANRELMAAASWETRPAETAPLEAEDVRIVAARALKTAADAARWLEGALA
jgi:hypothetical protein